MSENALEMSMIKNIEESTPNTTRRSSRIRARTPPLPVTTVLGKREGEEVVQLISPIRSDATDSPDAVASKGETAHKTFVKRQRTKKRASTTDFSGTWVLDAGKSDSLDEQLKVIGISERARMGAKKLEEGFRVKIEQSDDSFVITRTAVMNKDGDVKKLIFGKEVTIEHKSKKTTLLKIVRIDVGEEGKSLVTITRMPNHEKFGLLKATRKLDERGHMCLLLEYYDSKSGAGEPIISKRQYVSLEEYELEEAKRKKNDESAKGKSSTKSRRVATGGSKSKSKRSSGSKKKGKPQGK